MSPLSISPQWEKLFTLDDLDSSGPWVVRRRRTYRRAALIYMQWSSAVPEPVRRGGSKGRFKWTKGIQRFFCTTAPCAWLTKAEVAFLAGVPLISDLNPRDQLVLIG